MTQAHPAPTGETALSADVDEQPASEPGAAAIPDGVGSATLLSDDAAATPGGTADAEVPAPIAPMDADLAPTPTQASAPPGPPVPGIARDVAPPRWFAPLVSAAPAPSTIDRLRDGVLSDPVVGWLVTVGITALAFVIRFVNLGRPNYLVFDETYYAKDAYSLLKFGYERNWPESANAAIVAGNPNVMQDTAAFIVHPQVGKWLIAAGEAMFGMNSFGWRFMPLVFGTLTVAAVIRLARRLSRSTLIGGLAGLLLTLDGLHFVMSRIALLDIFQAFFIVAGVACLVADRDYFRGHLADYLERNQLPDLGGAFGPNLWWRPWRLAAGVAFGLAIGTKWNSMFALAACAVLAVFWDVGARRLAGASWKSWLALIHEGIPAVFYLVVTSFVVYVSTWASWLATTGGYDRDWGEHNIDHPWVKALGAPLASLLYYHKEIYEFHTGDFINHATHPYSAHPAGWLVVARPIGIDAVNDIQPGVGGCVGPEKCLSVISGIGTPALWWMAAVALFVALIWWLAGRDWRFGLPVVAALSTYLPWFGYATRPLFFFYAITIIPFTCICLALCLGLLLGDARDVQRRQRGAIGVGVAVALVALNFAFIYPLLTDEVIPYSHWLAMMWLRGWI